MIARIPILELLAVGIVTVGSAISTSASEPENRETCKISCVIWEPIDFAELYYRDGTELKPLELIAGRRTESFILKDTSTLEVHARIEGEEGQADYELVGLAPLIKDSGRMLFFVEELEDVHGLPLQLKGLDDSLETFPTGSFRFFNETSTNLVINFADVSTELPVGSIKVVQSGVDETGGFLPIVIQDDQGDVVTETRLFCQDKSRQMVFIRPPKMEGGRLVMTFLSELLPMAEQE